MCAYLRVPQRAGPRLLPREPPLGAVLELQDKPRIVELGHDADRASAGDAAARNADDLEGLRAVCERACFQNILGHPLTTPQPPL